MQIGSKVRTLKELDITIGDVDFCIPSNTLGVVTEIHASFMVPQNSTIVFVKTSIGNTECAFFYDELEEI